MTELLYAHVGLWIGTLSVLVVALASSCAWLVRTRTATELVLAETRAELRTLTDRIAKARTPVKTIVLPAYLPADPEEFRRTSVRMRYSAE